MNGSLEIGSISVGWLSPVSLADITLLDDQGKTVATVASASGDKTLVQLILDRSDLGHFDVESPQLNLVTRADGSNLEDLLAPLLTGGDGNTAIPTVALKVTGGSATVDDAVSGRSTELNSVTADVAWDSARAEPLTVEASAKLVDARRTADLTISLGSGAGQAAGDTSASAGQAIAAAGPLGSGHLKCRIDRLPLDVAEPLFRRRVPGGQLAGNLSAELDCTWGGGPKQDQISVQGQLDAANLLLGADALGHDRIEMARLTVPCQITGTVDRLNIAKLELDCDLGQIALAGTLDVADFAHGNLLAAAGRQSCQIGGKLDLVRLAALLPETLSIRSGTQITAGELNVTLASSQPAAGGSETNWSGKIETSDLEAVADGVPLKWQQPLAVEFQAHDGPAGPVLDKVQCDSSFIHVDASGTLDQLTAHATFDLGQLATQLAQFIDLAGCQLAGTGQGQLIWQRDAAGRVQSQIDLSARDFTLAMPNHKPWQEPSLTIHAELAGTMTAGALQRVDAFSARLDAANEQCTAQLTTPLDNPHAAVWPIDIGWQGDLAGLVPRISIWLGPVTAGWDLAGGGTLAATVQVSAEGFDVPQCTLNVQRLHAWGHGLYIDEPQAAISATAGWRRATGQLAVPQADLKTSALAARLTNLALSPGDKSGPQATGTAGINGDLAALARWVHDPLVPPTQRVAGQLSGQVDLALGSGVGRATLNATIDSLQVASIAAPAGPQGATLIQRPAAPAAPRVWQEPRLTLAARLDYDPQHDELQISQGELMGRNVQAQLVGKVGSPTATPVFDLSGQIVGDWEQLAPIWRPYVGDSVEITGREPWPFTLRGPWTSGATPLLAGAQRLQGGLSIRWLGAKAYGLDISRGSIDARLADGVLALQPVDVAVEGGQLLLAPLVRLNTPAPEIELPAGPMVSNVQLNEEICGHSLKYVNPFFAAVTRTSGQFSVTLQGGRLPLANPRSGDVGGQLIIQSAEMRPGPILQTLAGTVLQVASIIEGKIPFANGGHAVDLVKIENQTVDFRLVDGRVYHRNLQFTFGGITVTTRGSVGLDESLAVLAEIPMPPGLFGKQSSSEQQTAKIPITGTLDNPRFDLKAIEQLSVFVVKGAGTMINRLEGKLEKLVPGTR